MVKKFGDLTLQEIASWQDLECEDCPLSSINANVCHNFDTCLCEFFATVQEHFETLVEVLKNAQEEN